MKGLLMLASWFALAVLVGAAAGATRDPATVGPALPGWERGILSEACGTIVGFSYSLYRLPGLTDDEKKGVHVITRVRCNLASADAWEQGRVVRALGAAPSTDAHPGRPWILVALARNRSVRGWMPLHLSGVSVQSMDVRWSKVPIARVTEGAAPPGMPDLHISAFKPNRKPGDPCYGPPGLPVPVHWLVFAGNAGPGAGPSVIRTRIGPTTISTRLTRRILLTETVKLAVAKGETDVVVDPENEVPETNEDNNLGKSPPAGELTCGP